ncbi:MAG: peptidase C15 [Pleurocapsa sp.]
MKPKILLTSFQTWLPHHISNSSDDLLAKIQKQDYSLLASLSFLRNLPVDIKLASQTTIKEIEDINPDVVICCGMAEKRSKLTIESNAFCEDKCLYTSVDLAGLTKSLIATEVSRNAGKFVCEGLYYRILEYIQLQSKHIHCIFIHVPLLRNNTDLIKKDFDSIIEYFGQNLAI